MSSFCKKLQEKLAESGPKALEGDLKAQGHLSDCNECFSFLEALSDVEQAFLDLPQIDAADELVEKTLNGIKEIPSRTSVLKDSLKTRKDIFLRPSFRTGGVLIALAVILLIMSGNGSILLSNRLSFYALLAFLIFALYSLFAAAVRKGLLTQAVLSTALVSVIAISSVTFLGQKSSGRFSSIGYPLAAGKEQEHSPGVQTFSEANYEDELPQRKLGDIFSFFGSTGAPSKEPSEGKDASLPYEVTRGRNQRVRPESAFEEQKAMPSGVFETSENELELLRKEENLGEEPDDIERLGYADDSDPLPMRELEEKRRNNEITSREQTLGGRMHGDYDYKTPLKRGVDSIDLYKLGSEPEDTELAALEQPTTPLPASEREKNFAKKPSDSSEQAVDAGVHAPVGGSSYPTPLEDAKSIKTLIPSGYRASTIQVGRTAGVEGWAAPGTQVDVVLTYEENGVNKSKVIVENAKILSYSGAASGVSTSESGSITRSDLDAVTLALPEEERPKLEAARKAGKISLILANPDKEIRRTKQPGLSAADFLAARSVVKGLKFKEAAGYWSNTYIPGDPTIRKLHTALRGRKRDALERFLAKPLALEDAAHQPAQPFDSPKEGAIAVYLHSDRSGAEGESRMLVQVGLQGTERRSGVRPAMNVGIVLDLRGEISKEAVSSFRALISSFGEAKDIGDRFSLTAAGRPGGLVVEPENFKYGYLTVAMQKLFGEQRVPGEELGLTEAMKKAFDIVRASDRPDAPLGSSAVVLVTSQPLGELAGEIAQLAHQNAVGGVTVSAVGLNGTSHVDELDRIVLSGQGSRRLLDSPAGATKLVQDELSAVSRVVARALRLRIRLAPGVKLVDVIGSRRLDERRAQEVRDAEKSIDLRMARNLGIEADRGEDEEGIQIVIPSYYAGDSHVVLLDVVAPGPGPVADVTVRYKDLVNLKNAVARASIKLGRSPSLSGPLELNVLKNFLALELSDTLGRAGNALLQGDTVLALSLARDYQHLLIELRRQVSGFSRDRDIEKDIDLLGEYAALIQAGAAKEEGLRRHIADSLRLSGHFKVLPRPEGDEF